MTTLWRPDTCGCEIEYDDNAELVRVHKKCPRHQTADVDQFASVLTENRRKNVEVERVRAEKQAAEGRNVDAKEITWSVNDATGELTVDGKRVR